MLARKGLVYSLGHTTPRHGAEVRESPGGTHEMHSSLGRDSRRVKARQHLRAASLCSFLCLTAGQSDIEATCRLESIYALDANVMAKRAGVPLCTAETMFHIAAESGRVYLKEQSLDRAAPHSYGMHAAPWYLYEVGFCSVPVLQRSTQDHK